MGKSWDETWTASGSTVRNETRDLLESWNFDANAADRARLAAAAPDLVRALLAVEWIGPEAHRRCSSCGASDIRGHYDDCALAAALRKAGVIP